MELRFKRDTSFRKQFFVPDSFSHPAKMDAQLLIWIVQNFTRAGDVILDPMTGSGTTMLACGLGRNVILVELEEKFCKMMEANWELVKMKPRLGYEMGWCQIIQGDARNLGGLLCDTIITSPPYAETGVGDWQTPRAEFQAWVINELATKGHVEWQGKCYTESEWRAMNHGRLDGRTTKGVHKQPTDGYGKTEGNIGNLKGETYLQAMLQIYQQCHEVLKPEGLMILVTKNFIRNKQVIRLDLDTIKLCEQAGFKFTRRYERKLPSQSFWRIIYHQKHPEVEQIKFEDVLVFERLE